MEGGYPQGGAPAPQMMGYYGNMGGYSMPQAGMQAAPPSTNPRPPSSVSIWAGDLDSYMDENFLRNAVTACGWASEITRIKVVRDRFTGAHAGYGFLDAASPEAANRVLTMGSGMPIPGSNRCWRLNMGRSASGASGPAAGSETNVYVGDLDPSVSEFQLMSTFRPRYASVRHAKVVFNEYGQSRGFGFVRFGDAQEAERAVAEMQGFELNRKPIRLSPATGRSRSRNTASGGSHGGYQGMNNHNHQGGYADGHSTNKRPRQVMAPDDPNNTTLFIGGTANHITEDLLWREFSCFGELEAVRVPANKTGFAFVRFKTRECAQRAKDELSRTHMVSLNPHKAVRLEWATEQLSFPRPAPAVSNMQNMNASQPYDQQQYSGQYSAPTTTYNYNHVPGSNPNVVPNQANIVGALLMPQPPATSTVGATVSSTGMSSGLMTGNIASVAPSNSAIPSHSGANGTPIPAVSVKADDKIANHDVPKPQPQGTGGAPSSSGIGETEPPSKRAAVGRPEYTAPGKESTDSQSSVDQFKKTGTEGVTSAPFSWLNAPTPTSQPPPSTQ